MDVLELDVEILVHRMQRASQCHLILELDAHLTAYKTLEQREEVLVGSINHMSRVSHSYRRK